MDSCFLSMQPLFFSCSTLWSDLLTLSHHWHWHWCLFCAAARSESQEIFTARWKLEYFWPFSPYSVLLRQCTYSETHHRYPCAYREDCSALQVCHPTLLDNKISMSSANRSVFMLSVQQERQLLLSLPIICSLLCQRKRMFSQTACSGSAQKILLNTLLFFLAARSPLLFNPSSYNTKSLNQGPAVFSARLMYSTKFGRYWSWSRSRTRNISNCTPVSTLLFKRFKFNFKKGYHRCYCTGPLPVLSADSDFPVAYRWPTGRPGLCRSVELGSSSAAVIVFKLGEAHDQTQSHGHTCSIILQWYSQLTQARNLMFIWVWFRNREGRESRDLRDKSV